MANEINKYLEAALEGAEAIADSLTDNEIVKSIPVVGTAVKVVSGSLDLRDKLFLSKVHRFIFEIEAQSGHESLEFHRSVLADEESMTAAGEAALLTLDKLSDMKKASFLGFYFTCFLSGHLDQIQFRRIAAAIDASFVDDFERFLVSGTDELRSQKQFMEALFSTGLTVLSAGDTWEEASELYYEPSSMGRQVVELWQELRKS